MKKKTLTKMTPTELLLPWRSYVRASYQKAGGGGRGDEGRSYWLLSPPLACPEECDVEIGGTGRGGE